MKSLHRPDLFGWSRFDEERNIDFNSVLWIRPEGNVAIDPLPLTEHDRRHLDILGGIKFIIITNSAHIRAAAEFQAVFKAPVYAPAGERDHFALHVDHWLSDGDEPIPGLRVLALEGGKTAGELAVWLAPDTLITGDLLRSHRAGSLHMLPPDKLGDPEVAKASIQRLAAIEGLTHVLVGDGFCAYGNGREQLAALLA